MEGGSNARIHIDRTIEAAELWRAGNDALGEFWREELADLSKYTFADVTEANAKQLTRRSKSISLDVESIVETLDALRDLLSSDIAMIRSSNTTISLMCGLATLPDELFGVIFLYACEGESGEVDLVAAIRLSRVCRRFRDLVQSNPRFWTTITMNPHSTFPSDLLSLCLSRSKDSLLDITPYLDVTVQKSMQRFAEFLDIVTLHCHRWRSFNLTYHEGVYSDSESEAESEASAETARSWTSDIKRIHSLVTQLQLPNLQELRIMYPGPAYTDDLQVVPFLSSKMPFPKLHSATLQNYIPIDPSNVSASFLTISSLDLRLVDNELFWEPPRLLRFIGAFTLLRELALTLGSGSPGNWDQGGGDSQKQKVTLTTIRTFRLTIFQEVMPPEVSAVTSNLLFPNCIELELHFVGFHEDCEYDDMQELIDSDSDSDVEDRGTLNFRDLAHAALGRGGSIGAGGPFPNAESLCVRISTPEKWEWLFKDVMISLPLEKVPSLRSLTLRSDLKVYINIETHSTPYPALRTIRLETRYKHLKEWAGHVARKLDEEGEWQAFEKFVVQRVDGRARERDNSGFVSTDRIIAKNTVLGWVKEGR
ncbi:hypothetical protein SCHPADRAFT_997117 [Schizopora paradoxa]|uniref:F-box domain-containing protein n=1 Tax=Schizopora paradoxa TaxID=27342 RepID=A0A0H2RPY0_9AGAM|nr:hypothetical protein SCHPADRAFT_997117 [Schizopora paradoxa]